MSIKKVHEVLLSKAGEFVSRQEIEAAVYGEDPAKLPESNCLEVFVRRLRKRGVPIETKRNFGYRVVSAAHASMDASKTV